MKIDEDEYLLFRKLFLFGGWLIPLTEEEVAIVEAGFEESWQDQPAYLMRLPDLAGIRISNRSNEFE